MLDVDIALREELSREVELQVERICMLLLDARLAEWAGNGKSFDGNVETARSGLYRPAKPKTPSDDDVSPAEHLAYWFEARARYWKGSPRPSSPRASSAELLDQAKAIQGRLQDTAASAQQDARRTQAAQHLKALEAVIAVAQQPPGHRP